MKVTFFSNFLNHHQLPFCVAMDKLTNHNFTFVATAQIPKERLQMGYADINEKYPFALTTYGDREKKKKALQLGKESDLVIIGAAPECYIWERVRSGKLTFKYTERLHKKGLNLKTLPRAIIMGWYRHGQYQKYPVYLLCASAYTAADCAVFGNYIDRTYKWGYFPEVKEHDLEALFEKKNHDRVSLLWCGRLIDWKHPEVAVLLAKRLKDAGYHFGLNIIGNGAMQDTLFAMVENLRLQDCVHLLGAMSPENVRQHMESANIYLFTSDFQEGWGAVLNEAMNSGCAVVANHAIGSVPFLMQNGQNGMIYPNGDLDRLFACVEQLINDPDQRKKMGKQAYLTLRNMWNAEVAAERLLKLVEQIEKHGSCELFESGPCSRAECLTNDWY